MCGYELVGSDKIKNCLWRKLYELYLFLTICLEAIYYLCLKKKNIHTQNLSEYVCLVCVFPTFPNLCT